MCLWISYKKTIWGKIFFCILKVTNKEVGSGVESGSGSFSTDPRIRIRIRAKKSPALVCQLKLDVHSMTEHVYCVPRSDPSERNIYLCQKKSLNFKTVVKTSQGFIYKDYLQTWNHRELKKSTVYFLGWLASGNLLLDCWTQRKLAPLSRIHSNIHTPTYLPQLASADLHTGAR